MYEAFLNDPDTPEQVRQNAEIKQLIDDLTKEVKAQNHHADCVNNTVSLLGSGDKGTDDPEWRLILNAETIEVPEAIKAKIGEKWKVLAANDITVTRYGGTVEGKFTIGFSGEGFIAYKNYKAVVWHQKANGTIEELKPTWNEAHQCFMVVTDSFSPFVLAVDPVSVNTGITEGSTDLPVMLGFIALAVAGLIVVMINRRRTE